MVKLSQCMIVKNEEENIEKALSWAKDIAFEQIVVDTGSTDRTVELAKAMGAKVYYFEWIDDFATAKNYAISKATGDWIAFLDADESLVEVEKLPAILEEVQNKGFDGIISSGLQLNDEGEISALATQVRFFRNQTGLEYRRRIHEQLGWRDGSPLKLKDVSKELSTLHTGYCGKAWEKKKVSRRNLNLILKELEDHPKDSEMLGYLGDEYKSAEEFEEAEKYYKKAILFLPEQVDERDQRTAATFLYLMQIFTEQKRKAEALEIYQQAVQKLPKEADFDYLIGEFLAAQAEYGEAVKYLEQSLLKLEMYGSYNRAMFLTAHLQKVYEDLAFCYLQLGELQKAVQDSMLVLKSDLYSMKALSILLRAFQGNEEVPAVPLDGIMAFLQKLYSLFNPKDCLFICATARESGCIQIQQYMEQFLEMGEK